MVTYFIATALAGAALLGDAAPPPQPVAGEVVVIDGSCYRVKERPKAQITRAPVRPRRRIATPPVARAASAPAPTKVTKKKTRPKKKAPTVVPVTTSAQELEEIECAPAPPPTFVERFFPEAPPPEAPPPEAPPPVGTSTPSTPDEAPPTCDCFAGGGGWGAPGYGFVPGTPIGWSGVPSIGVPAPTPPIPEPSTWALLLAAAAVMGARLRLRAA